MNITERTAFLQGLLQGLELDETTKEGKLLSAMVGVLEDMANEIADLQAELDELNELADLLDEDLGAVEEILYEDDCDCDDCCDDEPMYELTCPTCGEVIYVDEDVLVEGEMECPKCGQELEFDLDLEDDAETEEEEA